MSTFPDCLNLFKVVSMTTTMFALCWGTYLGWVARLALPVPIVGIGFSGGALPGLVQV
jgi:hypothetical protein